MRWNSCYALLGAFAGDCLASTCWRETPCTSITEASFPGPWDANIYAPKSRVVRPRSILSLASGEKVSEYPGEATLSGNDSALVFDFGIEVGGVTSVKYTLTGDPVTLGLAWTEARDYIGYYSDSSNGNFRGPGGVLLTQDGALKTVLSPGSGAYEVPVERLRAGFRYLTVYILTNGTATLNVDDIALEIVFQPTWPNLRAYQGYFHSNDELLNKAWYSGAYTLQTDASPPNAGRPSTSKITNGGWLNNATIGVGNSVILDGAKRDRWIWPGDMGVAVPSAFYSTGDLESTVNALQTLYNNQAASGSLPSNGPPNNNHASDTYHMWVMIGTYNYFLFSGDTAFLAKNWAGYNNAMNYIYTRVQADGILNSSQSGDWGRYVYSTNGSAPNMLLYRTLITGAFLAGYAPSDSTTNTTALWLSRAESLRVAILSHFWDREKGAFFDGALNRTLYPQDANSYALAFGVLEPGSTESASVSAQLTENWTPIGPNSPELPGNVSPFISSIELEGHFAAGRPDRAIQLIHVSWGWYLNHPNGTGSTVVEGYLVDGTWGYRGTRGYGNDPSYVSHAHGWSSGPTSTLTNYLVGLQVTTPAGAEWKLKPSLGVITEAQAGFTSSLGKFSAGYTVKADGIASIWWNTPAAARGYIDLGDGKPMWVNGGEGNATVMVRKPCKAGSLKQTRGLQLPS